MTEPILLRRLLLLLLALLVTAGLVRLAVAVLAPGGWTLWEALILLCFLGTVPWSALSAANALLGFGILMGARDPVAAVLPHSDDLMLLASQGVFVDRYPQHPMARQLEEVASLLLKPEAKA